MPPVRNTRVVLLVLALSSCLLILYSRASIDGIAVASAHLKGTISYLSPTTSGTKGATLKGQPHRVLWEHKQDENFGQQGEEGAAHHMDALSQDTLGTYTRVIMDPEDHTLPRLSCRTSIGDRYNMIRDAAEAADDGKIQYYFALDLYQALPILPRLMSSIVQTIHFLGPERCALSIVEGRSEDGSYMVLAALRDEMERLGATFRLVVSDLDPQGGPRDRMHALADLRNEALAPLAWSPKDYSKDTTVIFLNDVAICPHDILELVLQHQEQHAHMTCGMDWSGEGEIFYDIYVARSLVGETFWQIAQDGLWKFAGNLFWADPVAKQKFHDRQPFQVYACWNGGAVFTAAPILKKQIAFRGSDDGECYMGEPTLFCKDMWRLGLGRIQIVPTVNLGYDNNKTELIKARRGHIEDEVDVGNKTLQAELVDWQESPPSLVKCMREFHKPYWTPST